MSHRTWPGKQLLLLLSILMVVVACRKDDTEDDASTEVPPTTAAFESILTTPAIVPCGSPYTSDLKVRNGSNIGTVTVANDATYLYLTYELKNNWYLVDVQGYAGPKATIPKNASGSPDPQKFPGKQPLIPCDMKQAFTFRVALASLSSESSEQCDARFFIAMRATIRHIPNAAVCATENDEEAWAAPILINPGQQNEWATAFYYCQQECSVVPPPTEWCAYGQGYWFASGKHPWGGDVQFGELKVTEAEGLDLWSATKRTVLQKAFFQAASLQLSERVSGKPMPDELKVHYQKIYDVLALLKNEVQLLKAGNTPNGVDEKAIQDATGFIGKWICAHKCDPVGDPTSCAE
jgi:hypothetical protein